MDAVHYEDLHGRLSGLLTRLGDRFGDRDKRLLHEFIDVGEFGLALEQMADVLAEGDTPVSDDERSDILIVARMMAMNDRVTRVLESCPRAE